MISYKYLREETVLCPNKECRYAGDLDEFEHDFDDDEEDITEDFDVPCVCPRCNQRFTAHCEPYVRYSYFVTEEIEE